MEQSMKTDKSMQKFRPFLFYGPKWQLAIYYAKIGKKDKALAIAKEFEAPEIPEVIRISSVGAIYAELEMAHEAVPLLRANSRVINSGIVIQFCF